MAHKIRSVPVIFIVLVICLIPAVSEIYANEKASIKIINKQGDEIESFQCKAKLSSFVKWHKINPKDGKVLIDITRLNANSIKKSYMLDIFLQAKGYASEFLRYKIDQIPSEIKLEKSVKIVLEKKNKALPGNPVVLPESYVEQLFYSSDFKDYPLMVGEINSEKWECELKENQRYVIGWKIKKGWFGSQKKFYGYCSEPFVAKQNGQVVNFEPGMPVTFIYNLSKAPDFLNIQKYPVIFRLDKIGPNGKIVQLEISYYRDASAKVNNPIPVRIPNLAAGSYYLTAYSNPGNYWHPSLNDVRQITIKPKEEFIIEPVYPTLDTIIEPNDVTIKGKVFDAQKNPLANEMVYLWIICTAGKNNTLVPSDIFYKPVKTDSEGKFEFIGVVPDRSLYVLCRGESALISNNSLSKDSVVNVSICIKQKAESVTVGKPFPFLKVRLLDGKILNLNELKGKVIVLDFWASWCSPCIKSMPKFVQLATDYQNNGVSFVSLSLDSDIKAWKNKVNENAWNSISHTWFDNTISEHKLNKGRGIPYYVIIDKNGIVRAAGNKINFKNELEMILNEN